MQNELTHFCWHNSQSFSSKQYKTCCFIIPFNKDKNNVWSSMKQTLLIEIFMVLGWIKTRLQTITHVNNIKNTKDISDY